jgi:hypothetical protein
MKLTIEERLRKIEQRNLKVETDKTWETSLTRRLSIAVLTYMVVVVYLLLIGAERPFIDAIVPPLGFLLSGLVMRRIREIWQHKQK